MKVAHRHPLLAAADKGDKGGSAASGDDRDPSKFGDDFDDEDGLEAVTTSDDDDSDDGAAAAVARADGADSDDADSSGKGADDDDGKPIPGKRAREMISKAEKKVRNEMQAQLDELRRQLEGLSTATRGAQYTPLQQLQFAEKRLEELRDEHEGLLLEGKKEEARASRKQLTLLEAQIRDAKVEISSRAAQTGAAESVRYQAALEVIEEKYPELNPDNDDYDKSKDDEVGDLVDGLVRNGTAKDIALKRAVKYVLGDRRKKAGEEAADPALQRTLDARKRAADAARKQPPDGSKAGSADDKPDAKLDLSRKIGPQTFKRYNDMSEQEKAKLRGDANA